MSAHLRAAIDSRWRVFNAFAFGVAIGASAVGIARWFQ
jgi:hypothetical protein